MIPHQPHQLGPYRVVRKLGEGGMGVVYQAEHTETGEAAAIKMLFAQMSSREGFRARFEVEIETLRKLHHPSIVRLIAFGEEQGALFYVMEMVEGANLEELIRSGRQFTWQEVTRIGVRLCAALKHAHDRGVIHRDIKPANVMMTPAGDVKLSDFGIAKLYGNTSQTVDGGVLGTANYMSPEQVEGIGVGVRSDLYSLGGVFYALLAGRPPFLSTSMHEMLRMQVTMRPEPLRRHARSVPPELEAIVMRLLEKNPKNRYAGAAVLSRALEMAQRAIELRLESEGPSPAAGAALATGADTAGALAPPLASPNTDETTAQPFPAPTAGDMEATQASGVFPAAALDNAPGTNDATADPDLDLNLSAPFDRASAPAADDTSVTAASAVHMRPGLDTSFAREAQPGGAGSQAYAPHGSAASAGPAPTADFSSTDGMRGHGQARFITAEDADAIEAEQAEPDPYEQSIWGRAVSLLAAAAAVAALGFGTWWLLRPAGPDVLYARITAYAAADDLRLAETDVRHFLERFPDHPQVAEIQGYAEQLDLLNLERRLRTRAVLGRRDASHPLEQLYLEAISYARLEPERAHAKLVALLDVYGDPGATVAEDARPYLELARRKVTDLEVEIRQNSGGHLVAMRRMLDEAESALATEPERCRRLCAGIIELYGEKPWATTGVARARELLARVAQIPEVARAEGE